MGVSLRLPRDELCDAVDEGLGWLEPQPDLLRFENHEVFIVALLAAIEQQVIVVADVFGELLSFTRP